MSASTIENRFRYMVEEGANWLWVLRDMDSYFFKKAFGELLINPEAETEEEIKCEKYFLLLNHRNMFVQNSAYTYINEVYKDVKECLKKNYNYTQKNISEDMIIKGLAKIF